MKLRTPVRGICLFADDIKRRIAHDRLHGRQICGFALLERDIDDLIRAAALDQILGFGGSGGRQRR